jgi:hypothetical protein
MDYFQGVVSEYLRADRSMFINTEFLLQLDDVELPIKNRHWYCDAVAVSFKDSKIYLCEISYSSTLHSLLKRLQSWAEHWPLLCESVIRDTCAQGSFEIQPWVFIPRDRRNSFEKKLQDCTGTAGMPKPKITELEDVLPWKYRSWNGKPYEAMPAQ